MLEFFDFGINDVVVHFSPGLSIDQVVVDIGLLGQAFHFEAHLLLVHELGDVDYVGIHFVPAILLLEQAAGAEQAVGALRMLAEIVD